jgi:hypothetical protein
MNVPIDAGAGLIFLVSAAVGYAVYRHTRATSTTPPPTGDISAAFSAGSMTLVALAFLFGVSAPSSDTPSPPISTDSPQVTTAPLAPSSTASAPSSNGTAASGTPPIALPGK